MIHGLLNLSRRRQGDRRIRAGFLDELVSAVVQADLAELIRSREARSTCLARKRPLGGPRRLHQLLANLISNGIKYNRSPSPASRSALRNSRGDDRDDPSPDRIRRSSSGTMASASTPGSTPRSSSFSAGCTRRGIRGHGRRPGDLQQDRPGPRRPDLGRERPGQGSDFFVSLPAGGRGSSADGIDADSNGITHRSTPQLREVAVCPVMASSVGSRSMELAP